VSLYDSRIERCEVAHRDAVVLLLRTTRCRKVACDSVAEQILEIAFAAGIKVRQDADLAQLLAAVDVDSQIPLEAFTAVAEILAYIYRANGRLAEGRPEEGP